MKKPSADQYKEFLQQYAQASCSAGKDQYTVQYFISGHPGSKLEHMIELAEFLKNEHMAPEQVQDFYPAPLTLGMAMWHCGVNPLTNEKIYVAKTAREKRLQRAMFFFRDPDYHDDVREALRECGREDLIGNGPECLVPAGRRIQNSKFKMQNSANRPDDGWGPNARRKKRYEEDHGMPTGGPGCGGGGAKNAPMLQKVLPDGE